MVLLNLSQDDFLVLIEELQDNAYKIDNALTDIRALVDELSSTAADCTDQTRLLTEIKKHLEAL